MPQSGVIALQGTAGAGPGTRVLSTGGRRVRVVRDPAREAAGAHVTGVDNAGKLDFMRALGADEVLDYRSDDFTRQGPYDLVLDFVAHRSVLDYRRALAPGGRYRCVGGTVPTLLRILTAGTVLGGERPPDRGARRQAGAGALRPARRALRGR